ncbi:MAG TPA: GntR family transcriptional regulator [Acetobacteraceae bacterium]|jgi:GntR family transcriptional regulator
MADTLTTDPLPLYHRVYLLLRQQILEGAWPSTQAMPGEHELAAAHGVSRITIRRALERLESEDLITRRRGAGTFTQRPAPEKRRENLRGLLENLLAMGLRTDVRLLEFGYVAAPPDIAAQLEVAPATLVQKSVRIRLAHNQPFSHLTAWVPEDIGRHYQAEDLKVRPLLALLEEAGVPAARAEQTISAKLADSPVAKLLNVAPGSALLWARRQVRNASNRVIEAIDALYNPALYEYEFEMVRDGAIWSPAPGLAP